MAKGNFNAILAEKYKTFGDDLYAVLTPLGFEVIKRFFSCILIDCLIYKLDDLETKWSEDYPIVIKVGATTGNALVPTSNTHSISDALFIRPIPWKDTIVNFVR